MKNVTTIDSYDYVVDFIENIASVMTNGVSKFGKYSVANGEISKMIIGFMAIRVKEEKDADVRVITDHMLAPKKSDAKTRKLAIEFDDDLIESINEAISAILSEGYKKIPSRTMFYRESLRTCCDIFIQEDIRSVLLEIGGYDVFTEKILGAESRASGEIGLTSSLFWSKAFSGDIFWNSLSDNYEKISGLLKNVSSSEKNAIKITEEVLKYIDGIVEEDRVAGDKIKFSINDSWIEISKNRMDELILYIEPAYSTLSNKIKFFILLSFIGKEFNNAEIKTNILLGHRSEYVKRNFIEFSELYIMSEGITLLEDGLITSYAPKDPKNQKLFLEVFNHSIRYGILEVSLEYRNDSGYDPLVLFLHAIFLIYIMEVLDGMMFLNNGRGIGDLESGIIGNIPKFKEKI